VAIKVIDLGKQPAVEMIQMELQVLFSNWSDPFRMERILRQIYIHLRQINKHEKTDAINW